MTTRGGHLPKVTLGVLFAAVLLLGLYVCATREPETLQMDANARAGALGGAQPTPAAQPQGCQIAFSINPNPTFATGDAQGDVMLENPAGNRKLLVAELYLNSTHELLYRSGALPPGTYISGATLDKKLDKGLYEATLTVKAYDTETQGYLGCADAAVYLSIQA